ncbi:NAD-glutamate dehydrogenase [Sandaracinobacter sp. RS1-74]|uniref:NAD-glutamate dehydrogenase n=1 Tax=Sandaracinobacteroides sayramensis TaxID=2913411 RepID=UPI001EDB12A9|nr:NAD-glutamate dehydrogenase [Sandaracinobacteroides sayramensis]MCG2841688.1 NAD-glutamate dehydrogenase [Sandaracinobacteroides sayramensis]
MPNEAPGADSPADFDPESFPADLRKAFRQQLYASATPSETEGLSDVDLDRLADLALATFAVRPHGTHNVHVGAGEGDVGRRHMAVILNTDDMPFLVDSATAAIGAEGLEIRRLIHPILSVRRDDKGRVVALGEADAPRESLILMDVERAPAKKRAHLAQQLDLVYADVRRAVNDWQPMLRELRTAARTLNDNPPPVAPHVLAEIIAFLEWLAADNFTLLGFADGQKRLGLLAERARWPAPSADGSTDPVIIHKAPQRSTVHRPVPFDVITVQRFDGQGKVIGAAHFLGLFASAALRESPRRVPLIRRKVAEVAERLGYAPRSHAGRALTHVIETFPREEMFQIDAEELLVMAKGLLSLLDRPRPQLFLRRDSRSGNTSVLVYIPRETYSADLRQRVGAMLQQETGGRLGKFDAELHAEGLARVHYILEGVEQAPDAEQLNQRLLQLTRGWDDELELALVERAGAIRAARLALTHGRAFSLGYRSEFNAQEAADDILRLTELSSPADRHVALYRREGDPQQVVRLKIYRLGEIIPLSDSVPMLENFGFRVVEEVPYDLADGELGWIHDFKLETAVAPADLPPFCEVVNPALDAVLTGIQENDAFNALIPSCGLTAEEANWLRAWFRYLRQTGTSYSMQTVVDALRRNQPATLALIALFRARLGPDAGDKAAEAAHATFREALDAVQAIDEDRILRLFEGLILAMLRTNAFLPGGPAALAFKLESAKVPGLPKPHPWREIWVYSPRVEGIHLRGGPIARGGLRWSDRRDDFRTEVLGLVKAQVVKNSVIVPTGAKGGFYPKQLPDPAVDRDGWAAEGKEAYKLFIRTLLSITDNLSADGKVVPPAHVFRRDADDPYLVVAADKGTASFSDTANAISEDSGFWLDDAFASGGSVGYDHKAMGITARGAWVSVTRHFAEMGIDVQADPVTVAGVGDMSGDVFGNGMLLSKALKLVCAFDHRHIFLDPSPDPAASWAERKRLFELPRSSWADYDPKLISKGGGVFPRSQKSIPLTAEVRALLGVTADSLSPTELMTAVLKAPVDLLWFGGIGTYLKATSESNADVGDRANDAIRVNGQEVRARVIGEGANLGVTQAGRIEYAGQGGRLNTDFIDNSAGVDTSDHEVNIKIALGAAIRAGRLDMAERDRLLASMTDEVAELVLANNSAQTLVLSVAESHAAARLQGHVRLMGILESSGRLDRQIEGLPGARELEERKRLGRGLTRPELAVLLSYTKMELKDALANSAVVEDPLTEPELFREFPPAMHERFRAEIEGHQLRRQIVSTMLANKLVNRGGLTLGHDLAAELGFPLETIAAAFVSARTLFDLDSLWKAIDEANVPAAQALALHAEAADITRILVGDLARRTGAESPARLSARLAPGLKRLIGSLDQLLRPEPRAQVEAIRQRLALAGAPANVIDWIATLNALSSAAGVVALASDLGLEEAETAEAYTRLGETLGIDWAQGATRALAPSDSWERLLAATTTRSFEVMRLDLIRRLTPEGGKPLEAIGDWVKAHEAEVQALARTIDVARQSGAPTLPMLAHLATIARGVLAV